VIADQVGQALLQVERLGDISDMAALVLHADEERSARRVREGDDCLQGPVGAGDVALEFQGLAFGAFEQVGEVHDARKSTRKDRTASILPSTAPFAAHRTKGGTLCRARADSPGRRSFAGLRIWFVITRSSMPSERHTIERRRHDLRQQLRALSFELLMRGSIYERRRGRGRPSCACAKEAKARHTSKFLTVLLAGRTRGFHLRAEDEERAQKAIAGYSRLWKVVNELTACEVAELRRQVRE